MKSLSIFFVLILSIFELPAQNAVILGNERIQEESYRGFFARKKIGLITNHTGIDSQLRPTWQRFLEQKSEYTLVAIFTPEHGLDGNYHAGESVEEKRKIQGIPVYSLHGETRRPTEEMMKGIDLFVYDIQDIGVRSYTFATTLFYVMEEAAKKKISVVVLDRPNPINGLVVDGPMLDIKWRSFIGYINVPYCHGMTIGEIARYFNEEYKIGCKLEVIPMHGWRRNMTFLETGLPWMPTSPHIPEAESPLFYAATGILGELDLVNIGVGYTLPFKIIGAPWIQAENFAEALNKQKLPGVTFSPFHYRPFYGSYKGKDCHGVLLMITEAEKFKPMSVQYALIGILKSLYPKQLQESLTKATPNQKALFCKALGSDRLLEILTKERYIAWALIKEDFESRIDFLKIRSKYLIKEYQ